MSIFDENRAECPKCKGRIETWKDHVCRKSTDIDKWSVFPFDRWCEEQIEELRSKTPVQKKIPDPSYLLELDHTLFDI